MHRNGLSSHQESIGKALSSPGIRFNKKTHINCYSSAHMAGIVCAKAGFPTNDRSFHLAHAALDPPTSLCKKLFPVIDKWHDRLAAKKRSPNNNDSIQPTVAAIAFVQVIMMFRKTFIQDSVLMMELHPCHLIWQHSIFSEPAYLAVKRDLLQIEAQEHDPAYTLLQQCAPMHFRFQTPILL
ncbi:hypothetical protein [Absidia glauca]|uniref:Ndc10 domain-containing protein n=1 Tax=Absidia glauca TaxID=4829 RepID=A0A168LNR1_ABSGL|nr:hypothetical protein [Absidia glauca]